MNIGDTVRVIGSTNQGKIVAKQNGGLVAVQLPRTVKWYREVKLYVVERAQQ